MFTDRNNDGTILNGSDGSGDNIQIYHYYPFGMTMDILGNSIGTEFNSNGTKAVDKVIDKYKNGRKGVYYNKHDSGKSYVGKGGKDRQHKSGNEKGKQDTWNKDESSYHGSKNDRDASEEEAFGIIQNNKQNKGKTYNKIISGRSKVNETFGGGKYDPKSDYKQ